MVEGATEIETRFFGGGEGVEGGGGGGGGGGGLSGGEDELVLLEGGELLASPPHPTVSTRTANKATDSRLRPVGIGQAPYSHA